MSHLIKLQTRLRPIYHADPPKIRLGINGDLTTLDLTESTEFNFEFTASDSCNLSIEFLNKSNDDTILDQGLDKAVVIESVSFFGIQDPKFVWTGVYEPDYPEPWATEQKEKGVALKQQLTNQTYLAWNGKWTLTFTVPVFTWIHNVQNLGWIYD